MSLRTKTIYARSMGWRGVWAAVLCAALALSGCGGGGGGGREGISVSNLTAGNVAYGRTLTLNVTGAGLTESALSLSIDAGRCINVARTANSSDAQTAFTCRVDSVGRMTAVVRIDGDKELARVSFTVPTPLLSFSVTDGSRSGSFVVELDPTAAPISARNFIDYVIAGFYNQTIIHRVLPRRIIQGGGYTTDRVLKTGLSPAISLESQNGLKNLRGTIAMARSDAPNSATSQYYINTVDNPAFDADGDGTGYAVFGRVTSGLDVVDLISQVPLTTLSSEFPSIPTTTVTVTTVVQTR